jgi:hypothetical protein
MSTQNPRRQLAPLFGASSVTGFDCGSRVADSKMITFMLRYIIADSLYL